MKITKKSAANFLEVTPPTLYAWIKAGLLSDPIDADQLYAFKSKYQIWYHCSKCFHEWRHKKPSKPTQCPKCRFKGVVTGLRDENDVPWITPTKAAALLGKSPATILRWIRAEILTNVGTVDKPAISTAELTAFRNSRYRYHCEACGQRWARVKPGSPSHCSKCGSRRVFRAGKAFAPAGGEE